MDYIQKNPKTDTINFTGIVISLDIKIIHYKIDWKLESIPASDISAVPARQRGLSWRLDSSLYTWFLSPVVLNPQASWFSIKIACPHFLNKDYQELWQKLPLVQILKGFLYPNIFSTHCFWNIVCLYIRIYSDLCRLTTTLALRISGTETRVNPRGRILSRVYLIRACSSFAKSDRK